MKLIAETNHPENLTFAIVKDANVGFYLYVYKEGKDIFDYLQDTLYFAKEQAFEDFGVPMDAWREVEE